VPADPYRVLGLSPSASDTELRAAYRRLVKETHPDHNAGSADAARRFEAVQDAYAQIQRLRAQSSPSRSQAAGSSPPPPRRRPPAPPPPGPADPDVEARIADLERQVAKAQAARAKAEQAARRAAREAVADASSDHPRPTDEELGYITTDDSLSKILADAREELSGRLADAGEHPVARRVRDLIDGLEELTDKLNRPPRK
jgi:multidrug efflux pump subunit AcrA (membrane-fusion protein)